jgi:hypothetical protein
LRLHESHHIDCHALATAGTILEGCRHMTFYTADNSTAADIKDFNWLREDLPSPNFSFQPYCREKATSTARQHPNATSRNTSQTDVKPAEQHEVEDIEGDDDEL